MSKPDIVCCPYYILDGKEVALVGSGPVVQASSRTTANSYTMRYEGDLYRPPSEAGSLILQATIGCSHNRCAFCSMYQQKKFRERELKEIFADIDYVAGKTMEVHRVFLADGNALTMPADKLLTLLGHLYRSFPSLKRVTTYANPRDILNKSLDELKSLREAGLTMVYLGVETGNRKLLDEVNKGATREEIIESGQKTRKAGINLSVTVINGLGSKGMMEEHARDTASLLNLIDPQYLGLLSLMLAPGTPMARWAEKGEFVSLEPMEILAEIELMLKDLELASCIFRSNHASNYLPLKGTLPEDKAKLLQMLNEVLRGEKTRYLRPEQFRSL